MFISSQNPRRYEEVRPAFRCTACVHLRKTATREEIIRKSSGIALAEEDNPARRVERTRRLHSTPSDDFIFK